MSMGRLENDCCPTWERLIGPPANPFRNWLAHGFRVKLVGEDGPISSCLWGVLKMTAAPTWERLIGSMPILSTTGLPMVLGSTMGKVGRFRHVHGGVSKMTAAPTWGRLVGPHANPFRNWLVHGVRVDHGEGWLILCGARRGVLKMTAAPHGKDLSAPMPILSATGLPMVLG